MTSTETSGPRTAHPAAPAGPLSSPPQLAHEEEVSDMCVSCGCGVPDAAHGDHRHITLDDLEAAARAVGISVEEVVRNISDSIANTSKTPSDPTTKR